MHLWLLLIGVFIPQEFASTAIVLAIALQASFPLWIVNLIWLGATLLDMYIGFSLGKLLKNRYRGTRLGKKADALITALRERLGHHGQKLSLAVLGIVNFPHLNAFFGAWLDMPMALAFSLTLLGNLVWYLILLATVLGLSSFVSNLNIILLILAALGVLAHFLFKSSKKP